MGSCLLFGEPVARIGGSPVPASRALRDGTKTSTARGSPAPPALTGHETNVDMVDFIPANNTVTMYFTLEAPNQHRKLHKLKVRIVLHHIQRASSLAQLSRPRVR